MFSSTIIGLLADVVIDVDWRWESKGAELISQFSGLILVGAEEVKAGPHVVCGKECNIKTPIKKLENPNHVRYSQY